MNIHVKPNGYCDGCPYKYSHPSGVISCHVGVCFYREQQRCKQAPETLEEIIAKINSGMLT